MDKKWWILGGAVAAVVLLGYLGWQIFFAPPAAAQTVGETAVVERGTLRITVEANGSLTPGSEVALAFSSGGRLEELLVEEGELVETGQPLLCLDVNDLTLQVAQAEATLAAAEAQLAQLTAPPRPEEVAIQEANLRAMEAQLSAAAADRDDLTAGADEGQIAAAEAQVASAQAQQKAAYDVHERTLTCVTVKLPNGTQKTVCPALGPREEQARYTLEAAEASLVAAQAQLDELQQGADADAVRAAQANVWTAAAQRDAAQAQLDQLLVGAAEEQVQVAQAAVDDARAALEQAQLRLEKATLTAPMAGTVTALDVEPGEIVNANQAVVVLSDLAVLEVELNLDETDVARMAVGQEALVSLDAFPGVEMVGQVAHIAQVAQIEAGVVLYPVTIHLPCGDVPARAGMTADVEILIADKEEALTIPLRAVHTEGELTFVERLAEDQMEQVEVELGLMTDTVVEVTAGLAEGDAVAVIAAPAQDSAGVPNPLARMFGDQD